MNAVGLLPMGVGVFALVTAGVCFRRAGDPMGMLERMKERQGVDYTRMVSDPAKYAAHMGRLSGFSGFFLVVVGLVMIVLGGVVLASPTREEQQARQAEVQRLIQQSEAQIREQMRKEDEARMKRIFGPNPGEGK